MCLCVSVCMWGGGGHQRCYADKMLCVCRGEGHHHKRYAHKIGEIVFPVRPVLVKNHKFFQQKKILETLEKRSVRKTKNIVLIKRIMTENADRLSSRKTSKLSPPTLMGVNGEGEGCFPPPKKN